MAERCGVWVYAVAESAAADRVRGIRGVAGGPVRRVTVTGLTALVEDVPLDGFGESALRRNLEDLTWLEATARAHHRVIDAAAGGGPVVPMRLATVYSGEEGVRAALADRAADFRGALSRIGTRQEWGIKAYAVPPRAAAPAPGSTPSGPPAAGTAAAGAGAAYLRRRREQISGQERARRSALAAARSVHAAVSQIAAATRLHPPQAPQLSGNSDQMILNASCLLDGGQGEELSVLVSALAERHPSLRLELTGPWPPYSFAGLEMEGSQ
jgi:Gas vesicle synthesis protein GvpL/GvpF